MAGEQVLYNRPLPGARLNMSHPLAKGLVGCWLLNENGGIRAMDLSPYGNHGLLVGFPSPTPRPFNGLPFAGANNVINCGKASVLNALTGNCAFEAWIKPASSGEGTYGTILNKASINLYMSANPRVGFDIKVGTASKSVTSAADSVPYGSWAHIVGVFNSTNVLLYTNLTLVTGTATAGPIDDHSASNLLVGDNAASNRCFDGLIALVRLWNLVPLNNAKEAVKYLYTSPYSPMGTPMFI